MTTSVIGALRVNLGLDSAQFSRGLDQSRAKAGAFRTSMTGIAAGLGAAFAAVVSSQALAGAADTWSDLSSRVGMAVGDMARAPEVMGEIQRMARASYSDLGLTAEAFIANSRALKDLGYDTAQQLAYTEALNNALVVSGAKGERAASVQGALAKAMALGKLSGDELNTVIASGGRVAEALAAALGTTVTGLRGVGEEGRITSGVIYGALSGSLEQLRSEAADMPATIGDGMTLIRNSALALVGVLDQTSGASAGIASFLVSVADGLAGVAGLVQSHAAGIGAAFQMMASVAAVAAVAIGARYAVSLGVSYVTAAMAALRATLALELALGATSTRAALAGAGVKLFASALATLRGAIIALGFPALIIAAGYLVSRFVDLVQGAGGFGAALGLLGDLASEVWDRIGSGAQGIAARLNAGWYSVKAAALDMFGAIITGGVEFGNRYVGIYRGAFGAVTAIWALLPAAIGDFVYGAANAMIGGVESMLNAVTRRIDSFITLLNGALAKLPDWATDGGIAIDLIGEINLPPLVNPHAGAMKEAGAAAGAAFQRGFDENTFTAPDLGLEAGAAGARANATALSAAAEFFTTAARQPLTAWQALKAAVTGAEDEVVASTDSTAALGAALEDAGNKGGGAGKTIKDGLKEVKKEASEVKAALGSAFVDLTAKGRKFGDVLSDLLGKLAEMLANAAFETLWSGGGGGGLLGNLLGGVRGLVGGGIGANANGTRNWRGGLTAVHERGGEIMDLPKGTRIIPNDISKRMADGAGGGGRLQIDLGPDLEARWLEQAAGQAAQVVQRAAPGIRAGAVAQASRAAKASKSWMTP